MQQYTWRRTLLALVVILALAAGMVAVIGVPKADAWTFSLGAECVLLEDGRKIVFTIDNTSEPQALNIIDQVPDSGIWSVPARTALQWDTFVPFSDPKVGASWEVLANWPGDQRPRHRVASVNFEQACPYVPPTTTTTTSTTTTTTTTLPPTTTTTLPPTTTTTLPPTTTTTKPPTTTTSSTTSTTSTTLGTTTTTDPGTTTTSSTTTTTDPCDEEHPLYDPTSGLCELPFTGPEPGDPVDFALPAENQSVGIDPVIAGLWVALILAVLAAAAAGLVPSGNPDE